jgi:lysophospholipase L1-like esterase
VAENQARETKSGLSSGKKFLFIIFNILVVVFVFGGLEFALRRKHSKTLGPRGWRTRASRDPWSAWRNAPHFKDTNGAQHDAQGFRRDGDVSLEKPANTVRIFFLGGSAAYGDVGSYPEIDPSHRHLYNNQLIDHYLEEELNTTFPSKRWEVINAATMEYRLHQELARIESVLLRYRPDYVILMDGYNDVIGLSSAGSNYDAYASTPHLDEFNLLANPTSGRSLLFFTTTWLKANSELFASLAEHAQGRFTNGHRKDLGERPEFSDPVDRSELTPREQAEFATAESQWDEYTHVARQINCILRLDGIKAVFLLQPALILTHKPLTEAEQRMRAYNLRIDGPYLAYTFEQLYPRIASGVQLAAQRDGFSFLDLTNVFDSTPGQTFSDYCHLTPEGNKVIAERLFRFLQRSFAETAGAASPSQRLPSSAH